MLHNFGKIIIIVVYFAVVLAMGLVTECYIYFLMGRRSIWIGIRIRNVIVVGICLEIYDDIQIK